MMDKITGKARQTQKKRNDDAKRMYVRIGRTKQTRMRGCTIARIKEHR